MTPASRERFFKYEGLGNDFVILDRRARDEDVTADQVRALCDRRLGIGADGVLVILPDPGATARMVVHNADGSVPEMCGNGLRCVAKYLVDHADEKPPALVVHSGAGPRTCQLRYEDGQAVEVEIDMGPARLVAPHLPSALGEPFVEAPLELSPLAGTAVSLGNPHLVIFDRPLDEAAARGPLLEHAKGFVERTNVEWVRVEDDSLTVVVWERGVGLTQACGTGACAAVAAAVRTGRVPAERWIAVRLPGGTLHVQVSADLGQVSMRGPARFVFEGVVAMGSAR